MAPKRRYGIDLNRRLIPMAVAATLAAAGALAANAEERVYRIESDAAHRITPAPNWNVAAAEGSCRLRIWVDDRARVKLHGDQIVVETDSGKTSFDQGSVCTQPLPAHPVDNFHVAVARGRGTVMEVREPDRRNDYTGGVTIVDPQNGGDSYEIVMAWNGPGVVVGAAPPPVVPGAGAREVPAAQRRRRFVRRIPHHPRARHRELGARADPRRRVGAQPHGNAADHVRVPHRPPRPPCRLGVLRRAGPLAPHLALGPIARTSSPG
jgi:hypothetical protein